MKFRFPFWLFPVLILTGCATGNRRDLPPVPMHKAEVQFEDHELLDVGIQVFAPGPVNQAALEKQHSNTKIRKSETHFVPMHLKQTLERTGYWGDVRVLPVETLGYDVNVQGEILESNGERVRVRVKVDDPQGYHWFTRTYQARAREEAYEQASSGVRDPFQRIYNAIANDMAAARRRMTTEDLKSLKRVSDLQFAADLVPEAFTAYTETDESGKERVVRYPAADDPMWNRVRKISARNEMLVDTVNAYYEPYYRDMWSGYLDWRKMNLVELVALRKTKGDGFKQAATGIALIVAAILLELNDVDNTSTLRDVMVLAGGQVLVGGINVSKQAEMHSAALEELSESFGADMESVVISLEGETVELHGTAEEQFVQWRELLAKIYWRENGGRPDPVPVN